MIAGIISRKPTQPGWAFFVLATGDACTLEVAPQARKTVMEAPEMEAAETTSMGSFQTLIFAVLVCLISFVGDGPNFLSPAKMQLLLLPCTGCFLWICYLLLFPLPPSLNITARSLKLGIAGLLRLALLFECLFLGLFLWETHKFAPFGYRLLVAPTAVVFAIALISLAAIAWRPLRSSATAAILVTVLGTYGGGLLLAIVCFPLNFRRSDMMAVIIHATGSVLHHQNPYATFYLEDKLYDFPYLPGTILSFLPAAAFHVDLRWAKLAYVVGLALLLVWAARKPFRPVVSALAALLVLSPYLQYRHDLYTEGHWFSLILVFVLMQRGRFGWGAAVFGISMAISQFSWVIFPFFLLNALRRRGWLEVLRTAAIAAAAAVAVVLPFLRWAVGTIGRNTVGQWDSLVRPIARPMNLAYWASYVVQASHLKWIQLAILSAIFFFCFVQRRCSNLEDTLRWISVAWIVFILFNVLLDGYFYLMLLVPLLVYTCVANDWLASPTIGLRSDSEPFTHFPEF